MTRRSKKCSKVKRKTCLACDLHELSPSYSYRGPKGRILVVHESYRDSGSKDHAILGASFYELGIDMGRHVRHAYAVRCDTHFKTPKKAQALTCFETHLKAEIKRNKPKVILTLGNTGLRLLGKDFSLAITKEHGKVFRYESIPVIPTYSPGYLQSRDNIDAVSNFMLDVSKCVGIYEGVLSPTLEKAEDYVNAIDWHRSLSPKNFPSTSFVGIDLEWTGKSPYDEGSRILCGSVSFGSDVVYFPEEDLGHFVSFLLRTKGTITGHNIASDLYWLGVKLCSEDQRRKLLNRTFCCTLILTYLYDHRIEPKTLKSVTERLAGLRLVDRPFQHDPTEDSVTQAVLRLYNCVDSFGACQLAQHLLGVMSGQQARIAKFLCSWVMPETVEATMNGMKISDEKLAGVTKEFLTKEIRAQWLAQAKAPGVPIEGKGSAKAVLEHVFGTLGFVPEKFTEKGRNIPEGYSQQPLWNKEVKTTLAKKDSTGFINALVTRDRFRKFRRTYLNNLEKLRDEEGFIHPRFVIAKTQRGTSDGSDAQTEGGTVTGRITMVSPSFQTLPRAGTGGGIGEQIRGVIVSRFGSTGVIFAWDYSQIELRVACDLAGCSRMMDIYNRGKVDIHVATACEILGKTPKTLTDEERTRCGKTPNFALIYGCTPAKLVALFASYGMKITTKEAVDIRNKWYALYWEFADWQEAVKKQAEKDGFVVSVTGRREYVYVNSTTSLGRSGGRKAVNQKVQATASDICSAAFARLGRIFRNDERFIGKAKLIGTVYDSIVGDCMAKTKRSVMSLESHLVDVTNLMAPLGWAPRVPYVVELKMADCLG